MAADQLEIEPEYVAARKVLLDALLALAPHGAAIILAGAQAVYLRTGSADVAVASFTTDGDLALDPSLLGDAPLLGDAMRSAGFVPSTVQSGAEEPGVWVARTTVRQTEYLVPIDLIVPEAVAPSGGRRGARLPVHGNRAARRAVGLEAALIDHDPLLVAALDSADDRRITIEVAGVAALLVAKAHKIHDRVASGRPTRVVDKDAADVFRLMQTSQADQVGETLSRLLANEIAGAVSRQAISYLVELFARPASRGVLMATDALAPGVPGARVAAVMNSYVAGLHGLS